MHFDVVIIGAGGAGMMCAIHAGKRGRRVALLDHSTKLGGKILISGGGRCNFTNLGASPQQYVSQNPHFCKSALSRYRPEDFIQMVQNHNIAYHEKKLGQLFCDYSAQDIVRLLKSECDAVNAHFELGCKILNVAHSNATSSRFTLETSAGTFTADSLVVATGGLSIPKIGATGYGYQLARQFRLGLTETSAALDGFVFQDFQQLAGISVDCEISCNNVVFRENILFTHSGLSGPAALQASLHWTQGDSIFVNLLPDFGRASVGKKGAAALFAWFLQEKKAGNRSIVKNLLTTHLPARFAEHFCAIYFPSSLPLPQVPEKALEDFCERLFRWEIIPSGTVGYSKAEVTRGGVDTDELSSKTLEAKKVPGLYFIGEVVDVTGWLGGYNFQWAWASGWAAGQVV